MSLWRLLYTGFHKNGQFIKMSLEEAAQKVKISKKSLDDYLMQLRSAKKFGFDFDRHINEKVGVIRSFVRKKKEEERKRLTKQSQAERAAAAIEASNSSSASCSKQPQIQQAVGGEDVEVGAGRGTTATNTTKPVRKSRKTRSDFKPKLTKTESTAADDLFSLAKK